VDDRTDDGAFGAMMSLALRPKFEKLRFQMIADRKGRYQVRLPLPQDVGDALLRYLECRPANIDTDHVLFEALPRAGPLPPGTVSRPW